MDNFPSVIYPREDIHSGKNKNHKQNKVFWTTQNYISLISTIIATMYTVNNQYFETVFATFKKHFWSIIFYSIVNRHKRLHSHPLRGERGSLDRRRSWCCLHCPIWWFRSVNPSWSTLCCCTIRGRLIICCSCPRVVWWRNGRLMLFILRWGVVLVALLVGWRYLSHIGWVRLRCSSRCPHGRCCNSLSYNHSSMVNSTPSASVVNAYGENAKDENRTENRTKYYGSGIVTWIIWTYSVTTVLEWSTTLRVYRTRLSNTVVAFLALTITTTFTDWTIGVEGAISIIAVWSQNTFVIATYVVSIAGITGLSAPTWISRTHYNPGI